MRGWVVAALFASVLWTSSAIAQNEQADLDKGRNAYLARQYDEADARFKTMLDPRANTFKDPVLRSQALMLWGAVKVALKKPQEASKLFEDLLGIDAQFEPDPLSYPTEVLDVFSDTRHRLRERLAAAAREATRREAERKAREEAERKREVARIARLEQLAGEETIRQPRSRYVAFIPFGAGQFQNGDMTLGYVFLAAETALVAVGTAVVPFYIAERRAMNETYDPATRPDATARATSHRDSALRLQLVNLISYGAFAATAIAGVVQANLAFVPETVRTQKREVPHAPTAPAPEPKQETSKLHVWPTIAPLTSGLSAGVEGRF